jgi:uncharacterized membrane protein YobD (UPF0266 family)
MRLSLWPVGYPDLQQCHHHGTPLTTWLLSALALLAFIFFWIRTRKSSSNRGIFLRQRVDRI